jgi:stage II sporulation protein P
LLILVPYLFISGCSASPEAPGISGDNVNKPIPEASIQIFGEVSDSGDIKINDSVLAKIKTRVYEYSEPPTILIYHTHATEAFLQDENYTYEESSEWRTEDNEKNIVHAGEVLKTQLEALGFNVIHDKTNVEPPELKSAYSRSLDIMKKYDGVDIYLDLHRNAADVDNVQNNTATADGKTCARLFFVVGTGIGTYEGEYDVAPDWKANYAFAKSVQEQVLKLAPCTPPKMALWPQLSSTKPSSARRGLPTIRSRMIIAHFTTNSHCSSLTSRENAISAGFFSCPSLQFFFVQASAFSNSTGSYIPLSILRSISVSSTDSLLMPKYS